TSGGEVKKTSSGETPTGNASSSNSNKSVSNSGNTSNKNSGGGSDSSNSKPSGGNSENSGSSGNSGNSGGSGSVDTHKHSYTIPITDTIHHDAVTHQEDQGYYETVTISEAWSEPVYDYCTVCNVCGGILKSNYLGINEFQLDSSGYDLHYKKTGHTSGNYSGNVQKQVDTKYHEAVTEQQWVENWVTVVDKEAWDETVTVGYKCSCGAEQK
ncbi:MAG TPA: hypothetical protein H9722_01720, partial [Candidatus Mediterraneibacter pullistercoris]|nr:hypothetical protein [Candidatus Mediterraneibacter pullistercoris]